MYSKVLFAVVNKKFFLQCYWLFNDTYTRIESEERVHVTFVVHCFSFDRVYADS